MFLKNFFLIVIGFLLILVSLLIYLKWFEKTKVFYPTKTVTATPKIFGIEYQEIFYETEDNIKLYAWFCKKDNLLPTILYCHGNGGNISDRVEIIKLFFDAGFNVFIFDWRGYGLSGGKPSEKGLYIDVVSSYNYLVNKLNISPKNIIVYGESLGSVAAIYLSARKSVSLLILNGAFSSAYDMACTIFPFLPRFILKAILSLKFDSISQIKNINIPKLFIHSKDDEIVPFALAEKLFKEAPLPKEFYITEGLHNDALSLNEDLIERIKNFIGKYFLK
ncbi:MAG: alpha/beta hydrolase [Candidatus Omnitrophica bacterium]|nr:alpha/beta hydrolase [Candidatus Omnitrophota bacterium]MCM8831593.1 alpha/beta hydrolase [Candidatus Omnitrophota bacterium]